MLHDADRREQIDMALLRRYHEDGDLTAREELAERCLPLVKSMARRYANRGEAMEDLVGAGTVGLVKAIDRFDAGTGHRFVSFAAPNIQGEIRRHFRDHTWAVHVPRSMQELDAKLQAARKRIEADTGREPSDDDLSAELDVTPDEVRDARAAGQSYRALSMDAPAGETQGLADTQGRTDPGYAQVEDAATIEDAMQAVSDRDRDVLRMRFQEDLLQREIAERIGVSQMQVSRIVSGAVERMAAHVRGGADAPLAA